MFPGTLGVEVQGEREKMLRTQLVLQITISDGTWMISAPNKFLTSFTQRHRKRAELVQAKPQNQELRSL